MAYRSYVTRPLKVISLCDIECVRKKHHKTLEVIFKRPTQSGVNWADIESLFAACGAYIEEREGSRVYVELNDVSGHFHRPHPEKETRKGAVESVRRFLKEAAIEP